MAISLGNLMGDLKGFTAGDAVAQGRLDMKTSMADRELRIVSIEDVVEHPDNRETRQKRVDELKKSFLEEGLAEPPVVRVHPTIDGKYEHLAGWHRILAYRALFDETHDDKWSEIPVIVIKDCDDERAERFLYVTNLLSADLTSEERGRAYLALYGQYLEDREQNPEKYAGARTADVMAAELKDQGVQTSARTISRDMAAARAAAEADAENGPIDLDDEGPGPDAPSKPEKEKEEDSLDDLARKALESIGRAVTRAERLAEQGAVFPEASLSFYAKKLRALVVQGKKAEAGDDER